MMRYYVVSDVHGFFSEMKAALEEKGFFEDKEPHKLVVYGDLFDRGTEALELEEFVLDLISKDDVILIRGNHEDLLMELLHGWSNRSYFQMHHSSNGTLDTVCQLTNSTMDEIYYNPDDVARKLIRNESIRTIIPRMVDYFETERYVFVHGWVPCTQVYDKAKLIGYEIDENWREASIKSWEKARWINGMEAAHYGAKVDGKTVVCGHWHCSFGHSKYEGDGGEFDNKPNFDTYYADGIIALDACTTISKKVNCIVVED